MTKEKKRRKIKRDMKKKKKKQSRKSLKIISKPAVGETMRLWWTLSKYSIFSYLAFPPLQSPVIKSN